MPRELSPGSQGSRHSRCPATAAEAFRSPTSPAAQLVLYFYPRADTPGCTKEAIDFSRLKGAFAKAGAEILGVSADPVPAQDKFKAKHKLAIALASDENASHARGLWRVAGEVDVRPQVHGHRAHDLPDRRRPAHRPHLAEGLGRPATPRRSSPPSRRSEDRRICRFPDVGPRLPKHLPKVDKMPAAIS